jgi:amino acid permease
MGTVFIFFGGGLSLYTGYLIAYCAEKTGGASYEEIANTLYGSTGLRFTSFCNILCNVGFLISYIALFKTLMPFTLENFGHGGIPWWIGQKETTGSSVGEIVWASFFVFVALFPLALPRSLTALRHTSMVSFGITSFVVSVIFGLSFAETSADGP